MCASKYNVLAVFDGRESDLTMMCYDYQFKKAPADVQFAIVQKKTTIDMPVRITEIYELVEALFGQNSFIDPFSLIQSVLIPNGWMEVVSMIDEFLHRWLPFKPVDNLKNKEFAHCFYVYYLKMLNTFQQFHPIDTSGLKWGFFTAPIILAHNMPTLIPKKGEKMPVAKLVEILKFSVIEHCSEDNIQKHMEQAIRHIIPTEAHPFAKFVESLREEWAKVQNNSFDLSGPNSGMKK